MTTLKAMSIFASSLLLAACSATQPAAIQAKETPKEVFEGYNCNQLSGLYRRKVKMAEDMEQELKRRADSDEALTDVWLITGLQLGAYKYNDGPLTDEYAEIKGHLAAMELVMLDKDCPELPF